jgi:hypothetical protein
LPNLEVVASDPSLGSLVTGCLPSLDAAIFAL